MNLQIKPLDKASPYKSILVKGEPITGKSWLTACFPNPILIDFDKNQQRLSRLPDRYRKDVMIVDPTVDENEKPIKGRLVWDRFLQRCAQITREYKDHTIIIDSATAAESFILMKIAASEDPDLYGDLSFANGRYQTLASHWDNFFSILTKDSGIKNHVVLICHESYKDVLVDPNKPKGEKKPTFIPSFTGSKTSGSVEKYFTDVWRCFVDTSIKAKPVYKATTITSQAYRAVCSLDLPSIFETSSQIQNIREQLSKAFSSTKEVEK